MERKIGEIFEYNGEWYQCVESSDCPKCDLKGFNNCNIHYPCSVLSRKDGNEVIFKKLEKVGEPYMAHDHSRNKDVVVQDYKLYNQHACYNGHEEMLVFGLHGRVGMVTIKSKEPIKSLNCENSVEIEIKQTKEDMEEITKNRIFQIASKYISGHITYDEFEEAMKNWVNGGKKESKSSLKEFDIEAAKSGKPVCTRDGRKARIICFDGKGDQPIIALVEAKGNKDALIEKVERYFINGHSVFEVRETNDDLMMLPEKKEGWVNVAKEPLGDDEVVLGYIFNSYEDAVRSGKANERYVATVRIEWEG